MLSEAELREIETRAARLGPAGADLAALVTEVRRLKAICRRMVEAAGDTDYDRVYAVVSTIGDEVDGEDCDV